MSEEPQSNCNCSVEGCGRKRVARGFCKSHWQRWSRSGDVGEGVPLERANLGFLRDAIGHPDRVNCLPWPFCKNGNYGSITVDGKHYNASHYMCKLAHGERPSEQYVAAHNCGNPICVNPHHIRWATHQENMADTILHGTVPCGDNHPHRKILDSQVPEILALNGKVPHREIAKRFGVSSSTVTTILTRKHRRRAAAEPLSTTDKLRAFEASGKVSAR